MTDRNLDCLDDPRDLSAMQMNRIAHLWGGREVEMRELDRWKPSHLPTKAVFPKDLPVASPANDEFVDPIMAAVAALTGSSEEVRLRSYVARRLAEIEERVDRLVSERVEAALAEKSRARRRVNPVLQKALERLREETKHIQLPPAEEVWKTINLFAPDEDED